MRIYISLLFLSLALSNFAQEKVLSPAEQFSEIYDFALEKYSYDPFLMNGRYYEYQYKYAEGHPFLSDNEFVQSNIIFHQATYKNLAIKYDVFDQEIIIRSKLGNTEITSLLSKDFLCGFSYGDKQFSKYTFPERSPAFYQVVAQTENLSCLYFWYKTRNESIHNMTFSSYIFSENQHMSFLLIDNDLRQYSNNRTFLRLFPLKIRNELAKYLKDKKIKIKKISEEEISEILNFIELQMKQDGVQ